MHVNKKLGRFKQWAGERMGGEIKTNVSDDFKTLEQEMTLRHEGMDRLQKSMTAYVKAVSKRNEGDDREKPLAVGCLGSTMVNHGENFEHDSEFGQCLTHYGRTNEQIARIQEQYITGATSSWLESVERSLAQMKEYQVARKKLETRRLAYDTSLAKLQKAKREDFRVEEELRTQKVKYEESSEDVYRRMQDIKEGEADSVADLEAFLEAELSYHDKCREALLQLRNRWPAGQSQGHAGSSARRQGGGSGGGGGRSRSNTAHSYHDRYEPVQEEPAAVSPERPVIRSSRTASMYHNGSPPKETYADRPSYSRTSTSEGLTQLRREDSPSRSLAATRMPSNDSASSLRNARSQLRVVSKGLEPYDSTDDSMSYGKGSPERYFPGDRPASPAVSNRSMPSSRTVSSSALNSGQIATKKGPPPPPPSRASKPPPPALPVRRSTVAVDL